MNENSDIKQTKTQMQMIMNIIYINIQIFIEDRIKT